MASTSVTYDDDGAAEEGKKKNQKEKGNSKKKNTSPTFSRFVTHHCRIYDVGNYDDSDDVEKKTYDDENKNKSGK